MWLFSEIKKANPVFFMKKYPNLMKKKKQEKTLRVFRVFSHGHPCCKNGKDICLEKYPDKDRKKYVPTYLDIFS